MIFSADTRVVDEGQPVVVTVGEAPSAGRVTVTRYDEGQRTWEHAWATSPYAHDRAATRLPTLGSRTIEVDVLVQGPDWPTVKAVMTALLDIVESMPWALTVDGKSWSCYPADSTTPTPPSGTDSTWRKVFLSIPARQQRGI